MLIVLRHPTSWQNKGSVGSALIFKPILSRERMGFLFWRKGKNKMMPTIRKLMHDHKKTAFIICAIVLFVWISITLTVNVLLSKTKDTASKTASDALTYQLSIGKVTYSFPNTVTIKEIAIAPKTGPTLNVIHFPSIKAKFCINRLIFKKEICITEILVDAPYLRWQNFCQFIRENFIVLLDTLKKIPKADVEITFSESVIKLIDNNYGPDHLDVDFVFTIQGDNVKISGTLDVENEEHLANKKKNPEKKPFLTYELRSRWSEEAFFLDSIILSGASLYSKFWGQIEGDQLYLKGFSFANTTETHAKPTKTVQPLNIIDRVKFFLRTLKGGKAPVNELAHCNFYFTDLDCVIKAALPNIAITRFDVRFNNAPVTLRGNITLSDPPTFDLKTVFYPAFLKDKGMGDLKQTDFKISGKLENDAFHVDSGLKLQFIDNTTSMGTLTTVDITADDFIFDFFNYPHLKIESKKGRALWIINGNKHTVSVSDLHAVSNFNSSDIKEIDVSATAYEGKVNGKLLIDTTDLPFRFMAKAGLDDLNANKLKEILVHFSKVHGRLNSNLEFRSYPQFDLRGDIDIRNGHLKNFDFFKWMSDTFGLHSLLDVYFHNTKTKFIIEPGRAGIYNIDFKAEDVKISGDFYIKNNDMASSIISMSLNRGLLETAKEFKPILNFFKKDVPFLDFDFQLSGPMGTMNFLWLPNWTKERIRARIPNFIERSIERQVDEEFK